jgi:hypothetical protein
MYHRSQTSAAWQGSPTAAEGGNGRMGVTALGVVVAAVVMLTVLLVSYYS